MASVLAILSVMACLAPAGPNPASGLTHAAARIQKTAPASQQQAPATQGAQEPPQQAGQPDRKAADAAIDPKKAESDLEQAISDAGNDRAALIRNLESYLKEYPDAPRKAEIYRALVETNQQIHDPAKALEYAERLIAIQPDDTDMMMLAVGLLEKQGQPAGLARAADYTDRVLDRMEKMQPDQRTARESLQDWQDQQNRVFVDLYLIRGRIEIEQQNFPAAIHDLSHSYELQPNASAAQKLGEIAEMQHRPQDAVQQYANAFVLPEEGPAGKVDRRLIRQKLGNVWRQMHGSDAGLGDAVMAAYDRLSAPAAAPGNSRNQGAKDFFAFTLRQLDGTPFPLASLRGKIVVMNFWATWCGPCRALEPLFAQVQQHYAGEKGITFYAVNVDEDESRVPEFVHEQKISVPVLYADGIDDFLGLPSIPVVIVIDKQGRTIYNTVGFDPETFVAKLTAAIDIALRRPG